ncbi:acyl-ACP--UDP-N-acetylglucosamine O-acyltransferase [Paenibacillus sp. CMAA1364]
MSAILHSYIHPTAIIHEDAHIGHDVTIGPYTLIGKDVRIGDHCTIGSHVNIEEHTYLGQHNIVSQGAILGQIPPDLKYKGELAYTNIGDYNTIREYAIISRGTQAGTGITTVGNHNLIMPYVQIAHDVTLANYIVIANAVQLAGHVQVEDYVVIGGMTGVHQNCRIGKYAMVGGMSGVTQDIIPYMLGSGNPLVIYNINAVGLRRNGFTNEKIKQIKNIHRILFRSGLSVSSALRELESYPPSPEVDQVKHFILDSSRGIARQAK